MVLKDWGQRLPTDNRGIFYLTPSADFQQSTVNLVPLKGRTARALDTLPGMSVSGLSVSPDFSRVLYARCDQREADIMLVENFKIGMTARADLTGADGIDLRPGCGQLNDLRDIAQ